MMEPSIQDDNDNSKNDFGRGDGGNIVISREEEEEEGEEEVVVLRARIKELEHLLQTKVGSSSSSYRTFVLERCFSSFIQ